MPRRASRRRRGARLLLRDLRHRLNGALHVQRIALTSEQVEEHDLPPQPGKTTDARSAAFALRHGRLVQVELNALRPEVLRGLYEEALAQVWDTSTYEQVLARQAEEREAL